jgi:hypothetical protein
MMDDLFERLVIAIASSEPNADPEITCQRALKFESEGSGRALR